jgi:flagellar basal body-associated protein FliL
MSYAFDFFFKKESKQIHILLIIILCLIFLPRLLFVFFWNGIGFGVKTDKNILKYL